MATAPWTQVWPLPAGPGSQVEGTVLGQGDTGSKSPHLWALVLHPFIQHFQVLDGL